HRRVRPRPRHRQMGGRGERRPIEPREYGRGGQHVSDHAAVGAGDGWGQGMTSTVRGEGGHDRNDRDLGDVLGCGGVMSRGMCVSRGLLLLGVAVAFSEPAFAQADFTGTWAARYQEDFPERIPGPELGDYLGLPINAAARQFADSWDPSRITLPEEQCR